jgi:Ca-activated chloride channel family protein
MSKIRVSWLAALLLASHAGAQNLLPPSSAASFRTDSKLVLVPVTVLDRRGATVNGLTPGLFSILEDKVDQRIASFSQQDAPVSIGVIFDLSGSMKNSVDAARTALQSFFSAANSEDDAFLYTVSALPEKFAGFTTDYETMLGQLVGARAQGSTALIDTIYTGLNDIRPATHARKVLLVISDGMDNHSRYSKAELLARAVESDVQIYAVSIYNPPANKKPIELQEERRGLELLANLAERTGGLHFVVRDGAEIGNATSSISQALRNEYLLGYVPRETRRDGKWHTVQVKLNLKDATAYTRSGYRSDE